MKLVYVYYFLMFGCFVLSLFYFKYTTVKWLGTLLFISIVTESIAEVIGTKTTSFFVVYHFFVPIEYAFITIILRRFIRNKKMRQVLLFSTVALCLICAYLSVYVLPIDQFPTTQGNIEAVLVIAWCLLSLLSIEPVGNRSIYQFPIFWFALGFLIYFVGSMSVNSIYNILLIHQSEKAKDLFSIFNSISNYLLYIFLSIGIISHKWEAKYSVQSLQSR